ncbi:hypothetical protein [Pseudoprevotella muciniphila]|nr:hypothetical protein [Pseudoprevotella muciniphila]
MKKVIIYIVLQEFPSHAPSTSPKAAKKPTKTKSLGAISPR